MTKKETRLGKDVALRKKAEEIAREKAVKPQENSDKISSAQIKKTLHELQVHQIELEMQNEELRRAQEELDTVKERYFDLYDLAPVGYCTISEKGLILEANLKAATILGVSREFLLKQPISRFIVRADTDIYYLCCKQLLETGEPQAYELRMLHQDGTQFWVHLETTIAQDANGESVYRIAMNDITIRKSAEDALREKEEKYRLLFENAVEGILIAQEDMLKIVNPALEEILGYPNDIITSKTFSSFIHPDDRAMVVDHHVRRMRGEPIETGYRFRIIAADGTVKWLHITSRIVSWEGIPASLSFVMDVTTHKQAEDKLQESEERYRNIFENAYEAIFVAQDGKLVFLNPRTATQIGYSVEELKSKSFIEFIHPDDREMVIDNHIKRMKGEELPNIYSFRVMHRDGSVRWTQLNAVSIKWEGKPATLNFMTDITEHKQTEAELTKRESLLNKIFNVLPIGLWFADCNGRLLRGNPAGIKIWGAEPTVPMEEYGVFKARRLPSGEEIAPDDWALAYTIREGVTVLDELLEIDTLDGKKKIILNYTAPVLDDRGDLLGAIVVNNDITDWHRTENEREKLLKQLFQSQKMEAIGTLAGGIAHDFNNILAVIIGYTELVIGGKQKENHPQYLQQALKGAERAKNLVKQILTFSRQDNIEKKPLDIKPLLKEAVKFLRSSIPATIEIQQKLTDDSCNIMADPTQMHQVIMNLCTNASHAMKKTGGIIKIELSAVEMAEVEIPRHPDLKPGPYVQMTISDTGQGIDTEHIQRIFDPFFTTKSKEEGTGLGLSVVYGIVKSHDGFINVYSEPDKGAVFNVYLPRIILTETREVDRDKPVAGGNERILFVDDEPALVDLGIHILSSLGYEVTGVTSSVEALDLFSTAPQRFDLVITDMTLPKMTGIVLSRKILKIRPDIPIVLCSGIREADTEDQAKSLGIRYYLIKPLTRKELARVVRKTLDGEKG